MRGGLAFACLLILTGTAHAQKPVGLFDCGPHPPSWAQFCNIGDTVHDERFVESAQLSEATGIKWVLALAYYEDPATPILAHAQRVLDRLRATGLLPHVVAFALSEEWYERCGLGEFARYGLPAGSPACVPVIRAWLGRQNAVAKMVLGLPSIWITNVAGHPDGTYQPIPPNIDFVALDTYIPEGGSFETHVAPVFAFAEQAVAGSSMRLVQIPPWFEADGYERPTALDIQKYAQWASRPLWFATWGFTWRDRPWLSMTGLESLPALRLAVEKALRIR